MKKIFTILLAASSGAILYSQQSPLSESYFVDKYTLAPSYAGNYNAKYLFLGYRSDWTGVDGGPKTFRLSFNDVIMQNAGYGAKVVYDKAGIFNQLYIMGSYSYNLQVSGDHHILFGISAGLYHNSLNLSEYYNDPDYNLDPALLQQDVKSKLKFMSDVSLVYSLKGLEAGVVLSNISFGDATYEDVDLKYNPLANIQAHASYLISAADNWDIVPLVILRSGKNIKTQFEIASQVIWQKKIMGSVAFRDPGIIGIGLGANISKGLKLYYNFNLATNILMNVFNNHEVTVGFNIFEYISKENKPMVE